MKTQLSSLKSIHFFLLFFFSTFPFQIVNAEVVKVDNIYYNLWTSEVDGSGYCDVVNKDNIFNVPEIGCYSGSVVIPTAIEYNGKKYTVLTVNFYAFANSTELTSVVLPSSVGQISRGAFSGCTSLSSITMPNVTWIQEEAFYNCSSLTSVSLPKDAYFSNNNLRTVFANCTSLSAINIDPENAYYSSEGGVVYDKSKTKLCYCPSAVTSVSIPATVKELPKQAFYGCSGITQITLPSLIKEIPDRCFKYCAALTDVKILGNVTAFGEDVFGFCSSLRHVDFPSTLTTIGGSCFQTCSSLEEIIWPAGVSNLPEGCFAACTSLKTIVLPEGLLGIGHVAFSECPLTEITLPSTVNFYDPAEVFRGCDALENVFVKPGNPYFSDAQGTLYQKSGSDLQLSFIPSKKEVCLVPSNVSIFNIGAKYKKTNLKKIDVSQDNPNFCDVDGILYSKDKTQLAACPEGYVFNGEFHIPESVTTIITGAFYGCQNLKVIHIPSSVTFIRGAALAYNGLIDIYLYSETPPSSDTDASGYPGVASGVKESAILHVIDGSKEAYLQNPVWNVFSNIVTFNVHKHSFASAWTQTATHHYHSCSGSGCDITDYSTLTGADATAVAYGQHSYGSAITEAAYYTCSVCEYINTTRKAEYDVAAQLTADKITFGTYKTEQKTAAEALGKSGDSDACKALISAATTAIEALTYDENKTLAENKAAADAIVNKLGTDLDAKRAAEKAEKDKENADQAEADRIAADKNAVEDYKSEQKKTADGLSKAGDTAACQKLITDAKAAIDAVTNDKDKTVATIKTSIDEIITKLKKDLESAREANGIDTLITGLQIKVSGSELCIEGAQGVAVNIYTMGGALVASKPASEETITVTLPASTYLVKAGNQDCKIQIK